MKSLNLAIQFLSKFPPLINYRNVSDKDMAMSVSWYPFIGAIYGLILYLIGKVLPSNLPVLAIGALMVLSEFLISGGLHYDGICDWADGWFSGRDTAQQLEIMKDSRTGVMGVTALLIVLLLKTSMLAYYKHSWQVLIGYGLVGKLILVLAIYLFPYARKQGTGGLMQGVKLYHVLVSLLWLLPLYWVWASNRTMFIILVIVVAINLSLALIISRRYQGLTGDCYGALHEISQIVLLISVCIYG